MVQDNEKFPQLVRACGAGYCKVDGAVPRVGCRGATRPSVRIGVVYPLWVSLLGLVVFLVISGWGPTQVIILSSVLALVPLINAVVQAQSRWARLIDAPDPAVSVHERVRQGEFYSMFQHHLRRFNVPERMATALVLFARGLDVSEVAAAMGLSPATVRVYQHNARRRYASVVRLAMTRASAMAA